jgi:type IV pilus assembly protein PilV
MIHRHRSRQEGIALLEALLAAVILAIGLLGTIGLQARAYSALSDAGLRAEATIAAEKLLGVMNTDQANLTAYRLAADGTPGARLATWYAETRTRIPGAQIAVAVNTPAGASSSKVDITISWTRKADAPANAHRITSYIAGSQWQ